jgi:16S rRNA (adenine1518-N6/adenine1519-N6)-dimethyltransferase
MSLPELPPLREVINAHGLFASKALGQNFLFDEQLLSRIAAIPGNLKGRMFWRLAPAGLTRALLRAGQR